MGLAECCLSSWHAQHIEGTELFVCSGNGFSVRTNKHTIAVPLSDLYVQVGHTRYCALRCDKNLHYTPCAVHFSCSHMYIGDWNIFQ